MIFYHLFKKVAPKIFNGNPVSYYCGAKNV